MSAGLWDRRQLPERVKARIAAHRMRRAVYGSPTGLRQVAAAAVIAAFVIGMAFGAALALLATAHERSR